MWATRNPFRIIDLRFPAPEDRGVLTILNNSAPVFRASNNSKNGRRASRFNLLAILMLGALTLSAGTLSGESRNDAPPRASLRSWLQVGQASWYGIKFQGHLTATGEHFNMNALTCAHRTLPLGSWIRVTNLRNRRSVLVRVNDRGPVPQNRIIDLSYAAAHAVGLNGIGKVSLETVPSGTPTDVALLASEPLQQSPWSSPVHWSSSR